MKKLLLASLLVSLPAFAGSFPAPSVDLEGRTFESIGSNPISITFEKDRAVLDTLCHDAVGIYSVEDLADDKIKINFALQDYINVLPKSECIQSEAEKSLSITALHALAWNESTEITLQNGFDMKVNMYGETGAIVTYNVK